MMNTNEKLKFDIESKEEKLTFWGKIKKKLLFTNASNFFSIVKSLLIWHHHADNTYLKPINITKKFTFFSSFDIVSSSSLTYCQFSLSLSLHDAVNIWIDSAAAASVEANLLIIHLTSIHFFMHVCVCVCVCSFQILSCQCNQVNVFKGFSSHRHHHAAEGIFLLSSH